MRSTSERKGPSGRAGVKATNRLHSAHASRERCGFSPCCSFLLVSLLFLFDPLLYRYLLISFSHFFFPYTVCIALLSVFFTHSFFAASVCIQVFLVWLDGGGVGNSLVACSRPRFTFYLEIVKPPAVAAGSRYSRRSRRCPLRAMMHYYFHRAADGLSALALRPFDNVTIISDSPSVVS